MLLARSMRSRLLSAARVRRSSSSDPVLPRRRGRDNTTVGRMSAVEIDPRTQGAVEDFEITSIGDESGRR